MATRDEINEAVRAMIETVTNRNVGIAELPIPPDPDNPPLGWPGRSYAILYPLNTSSGLGSMNDNEEDREYIFQVTCVGSDARQAGWMSSKVESAMVALKPGGGYLHDIPLTGHDVTMRFVDSLGVIVPSGKDSFSSADSYRLRICRTI